MNANDKKIYILIEEIDKKIEDLGENPMGQTIVYHLSESVEESYMRLKGLKEARKELGMEFNEEELDAEIKSLKRYAKYANWINKKSYLTEKKDKLRDMLSEEALTEERIEKIEKDL